MIFFCFRACGISVFLLLLHVGDACGVSYYVREPIFDSIVKVNEENKGAANTVVLVHGLGESASRDWAPVIPELTKSYHVVTFDLPGFGESGKANLLYSPERYAKFIRWIADKYVLSENKEPFMLVGHSMGGAISLLYASMYPKTLKKLILVDVAGVLHRSAFAKVSVKNAIKPKGFWGALFNHPAQAVGDWLGDMVIKSEMIPLPIDKVLGSKRLRDTFFSGNPNTIAAIALLQKNFTSAIEQLAVPLQIIWGDGDKVAPIRTGRLLQAALLAPLTVIKGSGHTPMQDKPVIFKQVLLESLEKPLKKVPKIIFEFSDRVGRCVNQDNMYFSGAYNTIEITGCEGVLLENVSVQHLIISSSEVEMYNSIIRNNGIGIIIRSSRLTATAVSIRANIGINTVGGKLDLAGVIIESKEKAVISPSLRNSKVVFSVSKIYRGKVKQVVHEVYHVTSMRPI